MRQTCQVRFHREDGNDLICGKPAVDFVDGEDGKYWLCADHFDLLHRIRRIMQQRDGDRDYKFRPPTPGKEID